jgi:hypothetical protein
LKFCDPCKREREEEAQAHLVPSILPHNSELTDGKFCTDSQSVKKMRDLEQFHREETVCLMPMLLSATQTNRIEGTNLVNDIIKVPLNERMTRTHNRTVI